MVPCWNKTRKFHLVWFCFQHFGNPDLILLVMLTMAIIKKGRMEERKEGEKEGRKEGRKGRGSKEGRKRWGGRTEGR